MPWSIDPTKDSCCGTIVRDVLASCCVRLWMRCIQWTCSKEGVSYKTKQRRARRATSSVFGTSRSDPMPCALNSWRRTWRAPRGHSRTLHGLIGSFARFRYIRCSKKHGNGPRKSRHEVTCTITSTGEASKKPSLLLGVLVDAGETTSRETDRSFAAVATIHTPPPIFMLHVFTNSVLDVRAIPSYVLCTHGLLLRSSKMVRLC